MATKGPINDPRDPVVDPMIDPRTGEYAVIAPGHNFRSVTQKIAGIVLTSHTPWGWFSGLAAAGGIATMMGGRAGCVSWGILLLFKQTWRNSINRFAEGMTIFAVCCAGVFPVVHTGRPW